MISKKIFQSEFGKKMWNDFFYYLDQEQPGRGNYNGLKLCKPSRNSRISLEGVVEEETQDKPFCENVNRWPAQESEIFEDAFKAESHVQPGKFFPKGQDLTLHDIVRYFKMEGVVGEESLVTAITLAAAGNISFGVEGFSGSGKTFIVDKVIKLLPEEWVYRLELSSKMAVFYGSEKINKCKILYVPELQKAMRDKTSPIIEVIKNLTEGKDAKRLVTNKDKDGAVEYSINGGKTVIYTLALENQFKKDEESSRRFMTLQTDSSREHLDDIHTFKAGKRFNLSQEGSETELLREALKTHIRGLGSLDDVKIIDPCAEYIQGFVPRTQKSVGYVDHYYSMVDGCVRFHNANRVKLEINGISYLVANVEDHFNVFNLYFREFFRSLGDFARSTQDSALKEIDFGDVEINRPNWDECLYHGYNSIKRHDVLGKVLAGENLENDWFAIQNRNGAVSTIDYKTGAPVRVAVIDKPKPAEKNNILLLEYKNDQVQ
jgi:hypothetical protein